MSLNFNFSNKILVKPLKLINNPNSFEQKIQTRIVIIEQNKLYKAEIIDDFNNLVVYLSELPDSKAILTKIIRILKQDSKGLNKDILINLLILLRKIIEKSNKTKTEKEIYLWEHDDCTQDEPILEKQMYLFNMDSCEALFKLFITYEDILIRDQCMKFAIAMLYDGNFEVQKWFLMKFESNEKDDFMGIIFTTID